MSLLLDTHIILWWLADSPSLPDEVKERLDHEPDVCISAASVWEVAIKQAIGNLTEPPDLPEVIQGCGFTELPITFTHVITAGRLPLIHRDPFDRMLVAQAQCEGLTLVSADPRCHQYDVTVLAV